MPAMAFMTQEKSLILAFAADGHESGFYAEESCFNLIRQGQLTSLKALQQEASHQSPHSKNGIYLKQTPCRCEVR